MGNYIGIDLGTSGLKAMLIGADRTILASEGNKLEISRPHPLWSEQAPDDWWNATCAVMDRLVAKYPHDMKRVRGIGLSGQMHGAVLLDEADNVLRPAILWNDGRSERECRENWSPANPGWWKSAATWPCRASPLRSFFGWQNTRRRTSPKRRARCCPRTGCGSSCQGRRYQPGSRITERPGRRYELFKQPYRNLENTFTPADNG